MFPRLPGPVQEVLAQISAAGGQGYVVGGAVRDLFMGKTPTDWDIAATLPSEALQVVFPAARPRGGRFGTVWLACAAGSCDITPCRTEWNYQGHRHPGQVRFHGNVLEDLRRRDFTVNAMAYTGAFLVDPFGGQVDIGRRVLRCVGDPGSRFEEDALRILRLFRFSATLGFQAELATLNAALARAGEVRFLSQSRVREETLKILLSGGPQALGPLITAGALESYGLRYAPPLAALGRVPAQPLCRWWALLALCGGIPKAVGQGFGFGAKQVAALAECERLYRQGPAHSHLALKQKIRNTKLAYGPLAEAFTAVSPEYVREWEIFREVEALGEPYRIKDLAVCGNQLLRHGFSGEAVGRTLESLLEMAIQNPALNTPEVLLALAQKLPKQQ